jgi:hypothetical protein
MNTGLVTDSGAERILGTTVAIALSAFFSYRAYCGRNQYAFDPPVPLNGYS